MPGGPALDSLVGVGVGLGGFVAVGAGRTRVVTVAVGGTPVGVFFGALAVAVAVATSVATSAGTTASSVAISVITAAATTSTGVAVSDAVAFSEEMVAALGWFVLLSAAGALVAGVPPFSHQRSTASSKVPRVPTRLYWPPVRLLLDFVEGSDAEEDDGRLGFAIGCAKDAVYAREMGRFSIQSP